LEKEINFYELIEVLSRGKWVILGICFMAVLTTGLFCFFVLPEKYEARATIIFDKNFISRQGLSLANYDEMLKSPDRIEKVFKQLQLGNKGYTLNAFEKAINTKVDDKANQIELTVSWTDAGQAREIANELGRGSVSDFGKRFLADREREISNAEKMLQDMEKEMAGTSKLLDMPGESGQGQVVQIPQVNPLYDKLSSRWDEVNYSLTQLKSERDYWEEEIKAGGNGLYIMLQLAPAPDKPVSPRKMLDMAVAGVLGMMVSIFLVFFLEFWRNMAMRTGDAISRG
jgi:capsular polysaccharide biosynthesis protein